MSQKHWCKSGQTLQVSMSMRIKLDQQSHQHPGSPSGLPFLSFLIVGLGEFLGG